MQTAEAREIHKQRAQTAEFLLVVEEKIGQRGSASDRLRKAELEVLWVRATYSLRQWTRLSWKPQFLKTQTQSSV